MIEYECRTHGRWFADTESGCPRCVAEMRAELTELRAMLAAAGIEKVDGVWTKPCIGCRDCCEPEESPIYDASYCNGTQRTPIPNLAPVAGGSHD